MLKQFSNKFKNNINRGTLNNFRRKLQATGWAERTPGSGLFSVLFLSGGVEI